MESWDPKAVLIAYIISNIVAVIMLWSAVKKEKMARLFYFLLFAWASWANWTTAMNNPASYLQYAHAAILPWYRQFIQGWFSEHILLIVGFIASCQALIAVSMLLKGLIFKVGSWGAIVFLLSILPLGYYAGFPCTLVMAIGLYFLNRKVHDYWWITRKPGVRLYS